jgi:hypothetical protein
MAWLRTIAAEMLGLFVDDGPFAAAILVWIALAWLVLPRLGLPETAKGPILFAGLASLLMGSALRAVRR